nr:immunoglobulin heavy chain junction region [Macaca mulatta]MOV46635.1 immunoglobulin heavy chain junction region [Macaca mulatta]
CASDIWTGYYIEALYW